MSISGDDLLSGHSGPSGRLGKYELIRELGRGGMGIVYLAIDTTLNRRLALKVLPHSVSNEERVVQRFVREAQAAARLRHSNIIPIYESGAVDGTYFFSMEYVPGVSVGRVLRALREAKYSNRGVLTVRRVQVEDLSELHLFHEATLGGSSASGGARATERILSFDKRNYVHEALGLFIHVAEALHYAHENGVVHRDIKPSNLLLAPDGRLMVADFGLAKIGDAQSITRTGDLLGSPSYMSPEQTMTRRAPVDRRTDVWSLGVTLYEFLTLKHPFEAKSLEVSLRNILSMDPRPPRQLNPRLPKDIDTILTKCLEKNPERRYATAGELAQDLSCVLNYESIQARSTGPLTRSVRFVRRNTTAVVLSTTAVLLAFMVYELLFLYREKELNDLQVGFAYFSGVMRNEPEGRADTGAVRDLQEQLRDARDQTDSLSAAIDRVSLEIVHEAEAVLPSEDGPGNLDLAMRALRRIRLLHLHNPDQIERERAEKLDRATADIRVRLVWAMMDELSYAVPGSGAEEDRRFNWLLHFLGTKDWTDGVPREKNPLVRRNAIDALGRLAHNQTFTAAALEALGDVLLDSKTTDDVLTEAVSTLADFDVARQDADILGRLAETIREDSFFDLPSFARMKALEALLSAPPEMGVAYDDIYRKLKTDPVPAIQRLASTADLSGNDAPPHGAGE